MESQASIDLGAAEPQVIGRYALFDELAAGGMATVHVGRFVGHVGFSRIVAIKRLHPQFAKDPEFVAMFLDEARLASRIQHPNVVATLDVVKVLNEAFLVMEYVQGASLSRLMKASIERRERVPQEIAASVAANMLHGLHAAHEAKSEKREPLCIVHRDVSPQNVLVGVDGVARVLDFGIAKAAMRSQSTRDGQMKGKLSYMSPEQLNGAEVDRRTDIFAAGIVLWESLAGRRLFDGADAGAILAKVLTQPIPSPKQFVPDVSDALVAIVNKALERDPDKRFQTAQEFAIAVEDAIVFARPRAIGEWVQRLTGADLARRAEVVARVESWSAEANRDAEFVTVMESNDDPEAGEATGLRARPSPPPAAHGAARRERVVTSPSQVGQRPSRERLSPPRESPATSPSQVAQRAKAAPPPRPGETPPPAEARAPGGIPLPRPAAPLPPLVAPGAPRQRVATSPSIVAQRAAMLGGLPPPVEPPRERVATSPSQVAARSAMLGAPAVPPPLAPPRERVATSPSQVAARSAMLGGLPPPPAAPPRERVATSPSIVAQRAAMLGGLPPPVPPPAEPPRGRVATSPSQVAARSAMLGVPHAETSTGEIARSMDRARVLTTPAKYRLNAPPLPPGVEPRAAPRPPPMQATGAVPPAMPTPAGVEASPAPEPRRRRPVPVWALAAAVGLAAVGGAILAARGTPTEKVSTPDFGASAPKAAEAKPSPAPQPSPALLPSPAPKPSVPVMSPADLPLDKVEPPPAAPPKSDVTPAKPVKPKAAASSGCNPPYTIDAKGIKRLKPNCI